MTPASSSQPQGRSNLTIFQAEISYTKCNPLRYYCPTLALAECDAAIARPTGDSSLAEELVAIVEDFPGINLVSLDLPLAHRAAQIAVSYRLRGADAVYVAVAEAFNATLFSWDLEMLQRCPAAVDILTPAQWLKGESL